jgi:hypothetical protein
MNTKEQIIQEIEQLPEPLLVEVLEFVRSLKSPPEKIHSKAVLAFLASLDERKEVYQRLADS